MYLTQENDKGFCKPSLVMTESSGIEAAMALGSIAYSRVILLGDYGFTNARQKWDETRTTGYSMVLQIKPYLK